MAKIKTIFAYIRWLIPDSVDVVVYLTIILISFSLSNVSSVQNALFYSDLNIKSSVLNFISSNLDRFLPENIAANLAVAIFWFSIGVITYSLIIFVANITSEVSDDLAIDKYVYPVGSDKYGRIKHFLALNSERIVGTFLLIMLLRFLFNDLLPKWSEIYRDVVVQWPPSQELIIKLLGTVVAEFLTLHLIVVLLRLIILRRRAFGL